MNRQVVAGVVGGFITGAGVGFLIAVQTLEKKYQTKYEESQQALINALERSRETFQHHVETPQLLEEHLIDAANAARDAILEKAEAQTEGAVVVSSIDSATAKIEEAFAGQEGHEVPDYVNHYAAALEAEATGHDLFVSGGINDYGVSYIEEDEFFEENGNFKGQITMVYGEHKPTFFMDGVEITDWEERLGDSIIVDFYNLVPPDAPPILYVRNHKRDEDYEVTRELP